MASVEIVRTLPGAPAEVFAVLGNFRDYGRYQPLTRIRATPGPVGPGWSFIAHTGPGPLAVPDRMVVTEWEPDRSFTIVKLGPLLDGGARVHLTPEGDGTRVVWDEEITPRPGWAGRRVTPLTDVFGRWFIGRTLDAMATRIGAR